ncbi:B-cell differentiation antigen CD72 [Macrotis lagotis]|uniref:B-cell differentiation antigen CD72 n=1 Tax=Macrotis lagotis TaxID=92651 RepID=UPI003D694020
MAESITYADLRFVKSPLKKSLSARPKQDPEEDEDGELTYENVQVPSTKDIFPSQAQLGHGGQLEGEKTAKSVTSSYSVTSPIARRILRCPVTWTPYILLSLVGTCMLLGATTISLGIQYMQISHQLRNTNQDLKDTNGSLWQQLQIGDIQLSRKEKELQAAREELNQIMKNLDEEKEQQQRVQNGLLTCKLEQEKTDLSLKNSMEEKRNLEEKLKALQNRLKQVQPLFNCPSQGLEHFPEYCCPLGWILFNKKCLYVSRRWKTWKQSDSFCQSLSSKLTHLQREDKEWREVLEKENQEKGEFWIQKLQNYWSGETYCSYWTFFSNGKLKQNCAYVLPFICEKEAFIWPVEMEEHFLH